MVQGIRTHQIRAEALQYVGISPCADAFYALVGLNAKHRN